MDFDGVFVTVEMIWRAVELTCVHFDIKAPTIEEFRRDFNEPGRNYWREHLLLPATVTVGMLEEEYFKNFDTIKHKRAFFPDVPEFLDEVYRRGIHLVIVSRSDREGLLHLLEQADHHHHFHEVIGRGEHSKDRQMIDYAKEHEVPLEQCAFIDDLKWNLELVAPTGIKCVGLARPPLLEGAQIKKARCGFEPIEGLMDLFLVELPEENT